jgi:two-component system OmpR family response regulator
MSRILVVEDEPDIAAHVVQGLKGVGHDVSLETRGDTAADRPLTEAFDLVVLDINLPGKSGFELLELWQSRQSAPIIVLTARTGLEDRLAAFDQGAVDFVTKPFFVEELIARIRMRLGIKEEVAELLAWADVSLDKGARVVKRGGEDLGLTHHELNVLLYLVERPGRAIARAQLAIGALSMDGEVNDRTVDSHLARVRKKLGKPAADAIKTVWGIGYRFDDGAAT